MKKYTAGIFILRGEPDHLAHHDTIKIMREKCETSIISIGSHNRPRTIKNPFTSSERAVMLGHSQIELNGSLHGVKFQKIRDYMYNDYKWAAEVYSKALFNGATQDKNTCLFGHFKDDSSYYLNMFPQWSLHSIKSLRGGLSSTDIRKILFDNPDCLELMANKLITKSTYKKLMDFSLTEEYTKLDNEYTYIKEYKKAWSKAPYAPVFVTTDSIVVKSGHVLLIKRGGNPGKGLYALPGGFLDQNEKARTGALRELKEETSIDVPVAALEKAVVDTEVFDHPHRSLRGRTITHVFLIDLGFGELPKIKAGDDAAGARWVPLADAYSMENCFFEDHFDIIIKMTSRF